MTTSYYLIISPITSCETCDLATYARHKAKLTTLLTAHPAMPHIDKVFTSAAARLDFLNNYRFEQACSHGTSQYELGREKVAA